MDFSGRYVIPASPETVWAGLNDPAVLKAAIPGCQAIQKTGPDDFEATATIKIGPVKATFKGKVTLADQDPPHRLTLRGEGQGGVAGFAKGEAEVTLTPEAGGTALAYTAKANVGGKLAQIGQRLIDGAAKQIADEFFAHFAEAIAPAPAAAEGLPPDVTDAEAPPPFTTDEVPALAGAGKREGLAPEIWVVGLIAVVVILLALFSTVL